MGRKVKQTAQAMELVEPLGACSPLAPVARSVPPVREAVPPGTSRLPSFFSLTPAQRKDVLAQAAELTQGEEDLLGDETLPLPLADNMIENVVGVFGLPLGVAVNLRVNGKDYLVPMVVEETSVVAAASCGAKIIRQYGRLTADADEAEMIAQIQVVQVPDMEGASQAVWESRHGLLSQANGQDPVLVGAGGGARRIEIRQIDTRNGPMMIIHLVVNCLDAMGANIVNSMAEALAPRIEALTGGVVLCRIVSNLAIHRLARAQMEINVQGLACPGFSGEEVARRIDQASAFAEADPFRATTHNKGVMNGVDSLIIATGNDWRAVEAGAHAYAARSGTYRPLATWRFREPETLVGQVELPLATGIVGGITRLHPAVRINTKITRVRSAQELAALCAASGLVQNFSALKALVTDGIQKGHMALHAKNVAMDAGAQGPAVIEVANRMVREGPIRTDRARDILAELRQGGR